MSKLNGISVPHRKSTASIKPVKMPPPKTAIYPVIQHIGAPAKVVVKVGDKVNVGTLLCEAGGFVSAPIYSGISGTVKKIEDTLISNGSYIPAVVIEGDGQMTVDEHVCPRR